MRVIITTATAPYVYGGAVLLVDWLDEALRSRGHEVETYRIPVVDAPSELPAQMLGLRMWDFTGHGDRLIAIRTPSHLVKHHSKVAWFLHHYRAAYDMWSTYPPGPNDAYGREFRRMLFSADDLALSECEKIFTNSARVSGRLRRYNGLESEVLYPPLGESINYMDSGLGDSIVYVSRVVPHKRQLLAVQALAHTRTPVKLVLAGGVGEGASDYAAQISSEITQLNLAGRVRFVSQVISEERKIRLLARALAVAYIPLDEDSYGFVGLEAAAAHKPLVTTFDSGGVLELVEHGVNGLVTEPTPAALATAFDSLYEDRSAARAMALAHGPRLESLQISWDHVVRRLLH